MNSKKILLFFVFLVFSLLIINTSCKRKNIYFEKTFSSNGNVNAVIEISAGTNLKYEYDSEKQKFLPDKINGKPRIVNYLPYPVNYGFIPSTLMDYEKGGDGDPLDILVICPALSTGTIIETIPIAMMTLIDAGEIDNKIIAIPANKNMQTVTAKNLIEMDTLYIGIKNIIETWFLNYKGKNVTTGVEWLDAQDAVKEIKKWSIIIKE